MAGIELKDTAVAGRSIGTSDVLIAADPSDGTSSSLKTDSVSEFITTVFRNPPTNLTDAQKEAIYDLVGAYVRRVFPMGSVPSDLGAHEIVNVNGVLYEGEPYSGTTRTMTLTEVTHDKFLGFFDNSHAVANFVGGSNLVAGDFFFNILTGGWETYRLTPNTGWDPYDPFASGEPFTSMDVSGTTVTLSFHSIVRDEDEVNSAATAVGQTFVNVGDNTVQAVTTYSLTSAADVRARVYSPPLSLRNNPRAYFYLRNQLVRYPSNYPWTLSDDPSYDSYRIRFAGGVPGESYDGGRDVYGGIFVASANVSSNIDTTAGGGTEDVVLSLPDGRHDIKFYLEGGRSEGQTDNTIGVSLLKIVSGSDDLIVAKNPGYAQLLSQGPGPDVEHAFDITIKDFISEDDEQYYFVLRGANFAYEYRGWLVLEYRGR